MEKPATTMNANVPTSDTMILTNGIKVERQSCKNSSITKITSKIASISVIATFLMDANRKSLVLIIWVIFTPFGALSCTSASSASICSFTSVALEPAVWKTIHCTP